ncbi:MAG: hypothetical protein DRQ37_00675 [Gammaproteobacteria bacterium]|nr:MAG: hypothetical protein DRQ37_00675 [Gammaproteobacteria bacterium]
MRANNNSPLHMKSQCRPSRGNPWAVLGLTLGTLLASAIMEDVRACGWWGDAEKSATNNATIVGADGRPRTDDVALYAAPAQMAEMGNKFRLGQGVPKDLQTAANWYRQAAARGHAGAQYNLALLCETGLGVPQDLVQAAHLYRSSAMQGNRHAQHHLAEMLRDGRGVDQDPAQSAKWFLAAAEQGHKDVFGEIGRLYWEGTGVPRNPVQAYKWWELAAASGDHKSASRRDMAAKKMDPAHLTKAKQLAATWSPKAAQ